MRHFLSLVLVLLALPAAAVPPQVAGCDVFPTGNIWNTTVDHLPAHPQSDLWVQTIGAGAGVHPDFGTVFMGGIIGFPFVDVQGSQPLVPITFDEPDESDPGPYPIPPDVPIEGGSDHHVLVVDRDACVLYELFDAATSNGGASWTAFSGAVFDLGSHQLRPDTWTSADAAGLPILPGLVRYDEVVTEGEIRHAIRFTAPQTRNEYVWPARHQASALSGPQFPPMGARFRLRGDFDASGLSAEAQVVVRALKRYGMMLADNGSSWFISGEHDLRWDDDALADLHQIHGSDFLAVDATVMMVDPDSGLANLLFGDGFESGDLSAWSGSLP
ncbi:MAG: hypothetical protein KDD47_02565 [Acidobacteria bacterium]|nr:hypothetical protein [Acidobacteriota bacterium]